MENRSAIAELDELAEQTAFIGIRSSRGKMSPYPTGLSDNILRAARHVERAKPELLQAKPPETKPAPAPAPIAAAVLVTSYTEAVTAIRARLGQRLNISYEAFDTLCSFPSGLSGKIFGPSQVKRLGPEKMFDALRAAGLRIRFEEDPGQTAMILDRIKNNFPPRQDKQARMNNRSHLCNRIIDEALDYLVNGKRGGLARLNDAVKQARSNQARRAANAFWKRKREHAGQANSDEQPRAA
jgi:hypothetical protein